MCSASCKRKFQRVRSPISSTSSPARRRPSRPRRRRRWRGLARRWAVLADARRRRRQHHGLAGKLGGLGLDMGQMQKLSHEIFAHAEQVIGKENVDKIIAAIPALAPFR